MYSPIFIGMMSGTSLDGVDAVAVDFSTDHPQVLGQYYLSFDESLQTSLLRLTMPSNNEIDTMGDICVTLGKVYAQCVQNLLSLTGLKSKDVAAIGLHGQTIRHRPNSNWTLQISNPAWVAEVTGIDVIGDFRSRDIAAGGQGAPLVPAFHQYVFAGAVNRAIVNIGGISNVSLISANNAKPVTGFDCGPGNTLMDVWCAQHLHRPFDINGTWAAKGQVHPILLQRCLADPYFLMPPPKSTGREYFHLPWLNKQLSGLEISPVDVQATLCALTAHCIAKDILHYQPETQEVYICGGGSLNPSLMKALRQALPLSVTLDTTASLGVLPMQVEAMAMAWLAHQFVIRQPGNCPEVTGARGTRILGALWPH